jgi:hypothetical protein
MAYFKSNEHFINYANKALRESKQDVDTSLLLPAETYIDVLFKDARVADRFARDLRTDARLLEETRFWEWFSSQGKPSPYNIRGFEHILTPEFLDVLTSLDRRPGVYTFWNAASTPLYVGVSVSLGDRIATSFGERFRVYPNVVFLRYAVTKTVSDAVVYEAILIAKLKPALNSAGNFDDDLTIDVPRPILTTPIACNVGGTKTVEDGRVVVAHKYTVLHG